MLKKCSSCSKEFTGREHQHLCSKECRLSWHFKDQKSEFPNLCADYVGAINELRVASDLLSKNFFVFKNICHSGPCDFVFTKDHKSYWDLQVKTGYKRSPSKTGWYAKTKGRYELIYPREKKTGGIKTKVTAIVLPKGEIIYEPKLESL